MLQFTSNSQCFAEALYYSLHNNEELCMSDDYQVSDLEDLEKLENLEDQQTQDQETWRRKLQRRLLG